MKKVEKLANGRVRVVTVNEEPSMTDQSFKELTDVNVIMSRYEKTGELVHQARSQGVYADVSGIRDYHESLQKVLDAHSAFASLDANVRNRFSNDPGKFLEFMSDSKNLDEAVELGLMERPKSKGVPPSKPNDLTNGVSGGSTPASGSSSNPSSPAS